MRCSRRTVCRVATNEYGPCVGCEPSPLSPIGVSFGGLTSNGSQATHPTHGTPRRLPHGEARRTCVEVPAVSIHRGYSARALLPSTRAPRGTRLPPTARSAGRRPGALPRGVAGGSVGVV